MGRNQWSMLRGQVGLLDGKVDVVRGVEDGVVGLKEVLASGQKVEEGVKHTLTAE